PGHHVPGQNKDPLRTG
ncbi:unnamed protein product, partial [Allacma fusca]